MKKIVVEKGEQDGKIRMTFRFKSLDQFLDPDDPTPIPGKELTEEAEDAISGYLDEYRVGKSVCLVIELPEKDLTDVAPLQVTESIRHHFRFRKDDLTHDLRISRREGMYSFLLMVVNIVLMLLFVIYVTMKEIPLESVKIVLIFALLTIMNWATIWDTYEHFFYDYRNLARRRRIFRKIMTIPIEVTGYR